MTLAGAIRWLTHTGREVSPSGLKSKQPDLCGRSTTKQPDLCGRSTTKMTFLGLYFSVKSLEKRIEERCAGSLVASQYKRTA